MRRFENRDPKMACVPSRSDLIQRSLIRDKENGGGVEELGYYIHIFKGGTESGMAPADSRASL